MIVRSLMWPLQYAVIERSIAGCELGMATLKELQATIQRNGCLIVLCRLTNYDIGHSCATFFMLDFMLLFIKLPFAEKIVDSLVILPIQSALSFTRKYRLQYPYYF